MNYGKKRTLRREKELASKSTMIHRKFAVICCKTVLVCCFILAVTGVCAGIGVFCGIIDSAPDITQIDASLSGQRSIVLDDEGNEIATLITSGTNREPVSIDQIPKDMQNAFIAVEDARFYDHNGIDIKGIIRAGIQGIASGGNFSQGASTITQQLIKNKLFTDWTSEEGFEKVERKIQEQYLAMELEKTKSKEWILENYLNTINLGQGTLGVQAASQRYFNKDVSELTLSECTVIAAITKSPTGYNPITNPDKNAKRRTKVLNDMLEQGKINQAEYDEALADDVYDRIQVVNSEQENDDVNSYFTDALTDQVMDDLIEELGYTETQAYNALYGGGLTIYSTQNSALQQICDEEVNNPENYSGLVEYSFSYRLTIEKADGTQKNYSDQTMLSYYRAAAGNFDYYDINFKTEEEAAAAIEQYKQEIMEEGDTIIGETVTYTLQPQSSVTLMDQSTGEIKALVGGRGQKTANKTLNRASDTTRQPGSTFKVLAAYAPALDSGGMTLATVQDDAPFTYANGTPLRNYDDTYGGFTTLRDAITRSVNIVTVKTLTDIGTDLGFSYLQSFGFTTLDPENDNNQSLCLGGIYNGVTNLELTAAYATIANGGTYTKPRFYTKIVDAKGNVLIDNTPQTHTVLKETTAWLLTSAMKDVVTSGTGTLASFGNMSIAGKTGTTTKDRDALFVGYTPYYTCGVWGGYDDNSRLNSTRYPKLLWRNIMERVHEGLEYKDFPMPSGITSAAVCKKSGKLAVEGLCDADPRGSMVETEYFAAGTAPTEVCDHHVSVTICTESGLPANEFCPESSKQTSVYIVGGSAGTADEPYLLTDETAASICNIHNASTVIQMPVIPDPGTTPNGSLVTEPNRPNITPGGDSGNGGSGNNGTGDTGTAGGAGNTGDTGGSGTSGGNTATP